MRAIVIGAGEVGVNVARTLSVDGHDVTVVNSDQASIIAALGARQLGTPDDGRQGPRPRLLRPRRVRAKSSGTVSLRSQAAAG